jgi:protein-tyrosine-phosphatase
LTDSQSPVELVRVSSVRGAIRDLSQVLASFARRRLLTIRSLRDRGLHPLRRRAALARLRGAARPKSVLVLCFGNICRSPYAAERLRGMLHPSLGEVRVVSAGFHLSGRPPPEEALAVAAERGIGIAAHRSRLVSHDLLRESELVILMTAQHVGLLKRQFGRRTGVLLLGDLDPFSIHSRAIHDPYEQSGEVFREVYSRIDRCVEELVSALAVLGRGADKG